MNFIRDDRIAPRYPTPTVSNSALIMTSCQMGSLNELEQCEILSAWKKYLNLKELPKADAMGDIAAKIRKDDIRSVIQRIYTKLKINKAIKSGFHDNLFFLVIDGHECCASYLRYCPDCLQREITTNSGTKIQYYHRYSMGMLISATGFAIPLDIEMQKGGEDEVACSIRLVKRLCKMYPRAFDVVMADGLYARAPFFNTVIKDLHKHVIAVLKDERRELIKEARSRCEGIVPLSFTRKDGVAVETWDLENCRKWTGLDMPVRVVRTLETTSVCRQETGVTEKSTNEWLWVTSISKQFLSTEQFVEVAHHRWDIENKGFNELGGDWHINHIYKHDSNAIIAFTLMTMLSYTLFHAFLFLNIKAVFRKGKSKMHFLKLIMAQFYNCGEKDP
jgi:hypothetical protein